MDPFKRPADVKELFNNATWAELEAAGVTIQAAADSIDCSHDTFLHTPTSAAETNSNIARRGSSSSNSSSSSSNGATTPIGSSSTWFEYDSITFEGWIQQHLQYEESKAMLRNMNRGMIVRL